MYTAITEFRPVLDTTTVHPARIAAANGGRNPYLRGRGRGLLNHALTDALRMAWNHHSGGSDAISLRCAAVRIRNANELTAIQLATR